VREAREVVMCEEVDVDPSPGSSADDVQEDPARVSEEDARKLMEQLRSAPTEQVVAEVFSTLLTAAEVKLGRRDARLFIDLCSSVLDHAGPCVSEELRGHVGKALGQLRLGQVSAESHRAADAEPEPNDLSRVPTPPAAGPRADAPAADRPADPPASRLWVPGR
jgi:hypothetical protein